jgi:hypothetical protein
MLHSMPVSNTNAATTTTTTNNNNNNNSVALVRERTIVTERPSLVGEVSANFCEENDAWSVRRIPMAVLSIS